MNDWKLKIWCVEYSEYFNKVGMHQWHIAPLDNSIEKNRNDMYYNDHGENKWQIVFIGILPDCVRALEFFKKEKARIVNLGRNNK